jgi:beta-1,4-mannooligosaccharide/beta-1,4-mannosyl-N-acetylglucosamine phosphorylase
LHKGISPDGIHWEIEDKAIQWVDEKGNPNQPYYAYDPRLVKIDDIFYIIWCTDFNGPTIAIGKTTDFKTFVRLENAFLPYNRNGVLFPRKIHDKFMLLSRPSDSGHTAFGDIFVSESSDLAYWGKHRHVMSRGGSGWWQGTKIGAGNVPIETDIGWLLFYHGVTTTCNSYVYSIGGVILDIDDPSKVLYRCKNYLLTPELPYELNGFVPSVCFPCSALTDSKTGRIAIYYGAADTYTALAFTTVDEVCSYIIEYSE